MMRLSFQGDDLGRFTGSAGVIASATISCRNASGPTVFSRNDFTKSVFDTVTVVEGGSARIHRGLLRGADGSHYFDIRVSQLTSEVRTFDLKIILSEELPRETLLRARIFWADGP